MAQSSQSTENKVRDYCRLHSHKAFAQLCVKNDRLNLFHKQDALEFLKGMKCYEGTNLMSQVAGGLIFGSLGYKLVPKRTFGGFIVTGIFAAIGIGLGNHFSEKLQKDTKQDLNTIISKYGDWPSHPLVVKTFAKKVEQILVLQQMFPQDL